MITQRFSNVPTKRYAWFVVIACVVGSAIDKATEPLWVHFGIHASAFEYLGAGLFWSGYSVLWLLVPIAVFRPDSRFYCDGDCVLRLKRVGFILALLTLMHAWLVLSYIALYRSLGRVGA
jgi:hypothetical protein